MRYVRIPVLEFIPALALMGLALLTEYWTIDTPYVALTLGTAFYGFTCVSWRATNGDAPLCIPVPSRRHK